MQIREDAEHLAHVSELMRDVFPDESTELKAKVDELVDLANRVEAKEATDGRTVPAL